MNLLLFQLLAIVLPQVFSDHMILQQNRSCPVWGQAEPAAVVQVVLYDEATGKSVAKAKAKADAEGAFQVSLPVLKAQGQSLKMVVSSQKEEVSFTDIAVGEVWICSGQSNMAYAVRRGSMAAPRKGEDLAALELEKPANPAIRVFLCGGGGPFGRSNNAWKIADGQSIAQLSAVGYFFAKNLTEALGVPVGMISASSGGSEIAQWMETGQLYRSQLKPLAPFAIGGFLWYQGESDLAHGTKDYPARYVSLTSTWRTDFASPDAPFYSVLICPHTYSDRLHRGNYVTSEGLPLFWQEQLSTEQLVENSKAIFISDLVDNLEDIHPSYKWFVGARLAKLALADLYKVENASEWSGPRASGLRVDGSRAIVTFTHCAEGLKARSNSVEPNSTARLKWFEVAGKDGIWHQAFADIISTTEVAVTHPDVAEPVSVRFAWRETAQPNLFNSEGLPAYPFKL